MELFREFQFRLADWQGVRSAMMGYIGQRGWGCTTTRVSGNIHHGSRANPDQRLILTIYSLLAIT